MASPSVMITPTEDPYAKFRVMDSDPYSKYKVSNPQGNTGGDGTGSHPIDVFLNKITSGSPLNPYNWGPMIQDAFSNPLSQEHFDQADRLIKASEKNGNILPIITGDENATAGSAAAGTAGDLTNAAILGLLGLGARAGYNKVVPKVSELPSKLSAPDMELGTGRAWKPGPNDSEFPDIVQSAISDINKYGGGASKNKHLLPSSLNPESSSDVAISRIQDKLNNFLTRASTAGVKISGDPIVQAVEESIPAKMKLEDPQQVASILERVRNAYAGKQFTVDQFRDFLRTGNASDSPFYNKSQTGQSTSAVAGNPPAIEAAITKSQREQLYQALDPENAGAGPRELQRRTGAIMDLRSAAERRNNSINAEKPVTVGEGLQKFGKSLVNTITGGVLGKADAALTPPTSLLHPFLGPTDALIGKLFEHAPEADSLPEPSSWEYPTNPKQLGSPSIKMSDPSRYPPGGPQPEEDASYVKSGPNPYEKPLLRPGKPQLQLEYHEAKQPKVSSTDSSLGSQEGQVSPAVPTNHDTWSMHIYGKDYGALNTSERLRVNEIMGWKPDSSVPGGRRIVPQKGVTLGEMMGSNRH